MAASLGSAGCASYRPRPLDDHDSLARSIGQLQVDTASMPTPELQGHVFDPSDGFDITEVAMLAVVNNPALRLLRAESGITRAQAFSTGLLPDPQLGLSWGRQLGLPAGATVAYTAGLTVDVAALLARSAKRSAADAENRKSNLNLLWQEWQTVAAARLQFVKLDALGATLALLTQQIDALQPRLDRTQTAVDRGLLSADAAIPQAAALQDLRRQQSDVARQHNLARHELNALLGVAPELVLRLTGAPELRMPDAAEVAAALAEAPRKRPDLLALQSGYAAQDDLYRGALRAQFPAITVGPNRSRDTTNVNTAGLSLGIGLPLFNRNRGNIAIEEATREKLHTEYRQRLDATRIDAHRLLAEADILLRQRAQIDASIEQLAAAARRVETAFSAQGIDALTLTSAEGAVLAKRLERITTQQALWEQAIALQALIGTDFSAPARAGDRPA